MALSLLFAEPVCAQTAKDIETLIKASTLVDTARTLSATVAPPEVRISTYTSTRASEKDCKITALLIIKEISQTYKNITRARISFFDEYNARRYRTVTVTNQHAALVDSGKPFAEVLATIPIADGVIPEKNYFRSVRPGAYYKQRIELLAAVKQLMENGVQADDCLSSFARLEEACSRQRPNRRYCAVLYSSIVLSINRHKAQLSRKQKKDKTDATVQITAIGESVRKTYGDEIYNKVRSRLGSGTPPSARNIDGLIKEIEGEIRSGE
ncbi:MAG TPA: hypothetical protein V6D17_20810 [Candidatus Obscuribacterales bacterium]